MRKIRLREKMRVFTDVDQEREREFQEYLEDLKYWAEVRMAFYDNELTREERDYEKEHG